MSAEPFSFPLLPDFHHLCAALRAPSAGNRMNEIAAQAPHVQRTGECVWLALLTLLRCLILKDHNHVHGAFPNGTEGYVLDSQRRPVGGIVRLPDR